jgi:hypothetical protein
MVEHRDAAALINLDRAWSYLHTIQGANPEVTFHGGRHGVLLVK